MSEPPEAESFAAQWVERAEHDLINAEHAVESRYPGEWDPIELEEANDAVEIARCVRASIRGALALPD